jgi:hypothetical protein
VQFTACSKDLRVTAGGTGVVSHVGAALLRMLADRAGLTAALSAGLARAGRWPVHDRGRRLHRTRRGRYHRSLSVPGGH